jgi:arylsulfatase
MTDQIDRTTLPLRRPEFAGVANRTLDGSQPDWAQLSHAQPPEGAPNVLLVLLDDAGFGNPSTFGGPIDTPTFTRLADEGLRYNRFHVTAVCSPTRAALLTSRNHHTVGYGCISELVGGFPGYSTLIPKDTAPFPRILQENGYATACFGKWHLTPEDDQGPAGPFDRWPSGLGFDYFWGFLGGEAGQYDPLIAENNQIVGVPEAKDGEEYYLPDDMTDRAIGWLHKMRAHKSEKPWFMYYTTGATHAPHHVPNEWTTKYKGMFDKGWDAIREETFERQKELGVVPSDTELTPRPSEMPAWDSLGEAEQKLFARQMEVYAGYMENADWNVGRVVDAIEEMGELDNTLVIYILGDNGASMEGTLTGSFNELTMLNGIKLNPEQQMQLLEQYGGLDAWGGSDLAPHYSATWAWAGNAPFQWGKQVASHLGGTRNAMVAHWPDKIRGHGEVRSHFTHVIDVGPTILEAAGIPAPDVVDGIEQQPLHGFTFLDSFHDADAQERHTQQYFETVGNRAMYKDGWMLSQRMPRVPWEMDKETLAQFAPGVWDPDSDPVELYYLPDDFSQANDLSGQYPDKVKELQELFWEEAEKYGVLPLLGGISFYFGLVPAIPQRSLFTYYGDVENVTEGSMAPTKNHSYTISADLSVPEEGAEGVIVAVGDHLGGFSFFVDEGKLMHTYSFMGVQVYRQEAETPLPAGDVNVKMVFAADAAAPATGGQVTLMVDDVAVGEGRMEHTVPWHFGVGGMDVSKDNGGVVDKRYADRAPFEFTGTVNKVVFDVAPHIDEAEEHALHEQVQSAGAARGLGA